MALSNFRFDDRRRLIPLVAVLLVAGFLATSFANYFVSTASVREGIVESGLPLTSDNIYSEIQRDLLQPIFISSMMASDTFLRDWAIEGEQDLVRITNYLAEIKRRYGTVTSFFVSDRTHVYYHADGYLKHISPGEWRDVWYYRVREMEKPYEINIDPDFANRDAMTIFINYRVLDYAEKFIGVTGVGLTVTTMRERVDRYRERFGRLVYFVDRKGKVALAGAGADDNDIRARTGLSTLADKILAGERGSWAYESNGRTMLLNTRFIPELGWHLFVEQDEHVATANIREALMVNLLVSLAITVIVVAATSYTIRWYQSRIEYMAITDGLTGLLNRRGFEAVFAQALRESERSGQPLSVVLFDIDRFKGINDRFGHAAGDAILRHVAETARASLRESDVLCRWGGEEFLALAKNCAAADATKLAEKVGENVRGRPYSLDGQRIATTVSSGIAERLPGEEAKDLLARADQALYVAKEGGRDRAVRA